MTFLAVPIVALLAWQLVPVAPFGIDGWRWVGGGGVAAGAVMRYSQAAVAAYGMPA